MSSTRRDEKFVEGKVDADVDAPHVKLRQPDQRPLIPHSRSRWMYPCLGVLVLGVVIQLTGYWDGMDWMRRRSGSFWSQADVSHDSEVIGMQLFRKHDINNDGYLTIEEFEPLALRLMSVNDTIKYERNITTEEEILTLEAKFQPLKLETLTKDLSFQGQGMDHLQGLKSWTAPTKARQNFGVRDFLAFLPKDGIRAGSLGSVYWLVEGNGERGPSLSSNRYLPPQLESEAEVMIHRLLCLFHPMPFVHMRFAPKGSTATVRAYNDDHVDIVFRIHAEFQLNEPPFYPFWFTPAQFTGHLTISQNASHILDFHLYVPDDKRLNVDMEWMTGPTDSINMEVDIGYMPQMELASTRPSKPAMVDGVDLRKVFLPHAFETHKIIWKEEISLEEAQQLLEKEMFPFKQVTYFNFTEGLSEATRLGRPLHSILLWGCLDDQSC